MAVAVVAFVLPRFFYCCRPPQLEQQQQRLLLLFLHHRPGSPQFHLPSFLPPLAPSIPASARPPLPSSANITTFHAWRRHSFLHGHASCGKNRVCFTTSSASSQSSSTPRFTNTDASFDWSDDDDDANKEQSSAAADDKHKGKPPLDKSKLPPPYDPFSKKPVVEEPKDRKDLQEIFHKMRTEGLTNYAIKMFDGLSKDGLTHEALALFAQIKDKGTMPDVVAHTAVIEAYANAGDHSKEALKTYERMLASGVTPNAYTYSVLIRGLAADGKLKDAAKYVRDMMGKGMKPNVATYAAVFEAYVKEEKADDARALLEEMRGTGFTPDEKAVREHLGKRGRVFRSLMSLLFGK